MNNFICGILNKFIDNIKCAFKTRFSDKINLFLLSTSLASVLVAINCIEKNLHFFSFSYQMAESVLVCALFCIFIFYPKITSDKNNGNEEENSLKMPCILLFSLFSSYRILYLYASNITKIPLLWGLCFILFFALLFLCFYWFFKIVFKDDNKSVILSLIIMFAINLQFNDLGYIRSYFGLLFYAEIFALTFLNAKKIVSFLKPFSAALIIFCILNGGYNIIASENISQFIKRFSKTAASKDETFAKIPKRDIYIILLDAHAGKRTLRHLGMDNSDFINKLKQKGFIVYEDMESNYNLTIGSIPSFLNADYVQNLSHETLTDAVNNSKVLWLAKNSGYKVYYLNSYPTEIKIKKYPIDELYCAEDNILEEITRLFLDKRMIYRFIHFNENTVAQKMQKNFDFMESTIKNGGKKRFVFAHFLMPHGPYIFDEDGNVNPSSVHYDFYMGNDVSLINKEKYIGYLKFADDKALNYVDKIFALKREKPIIIIMGDHGARLTLYHRYKDIYEDRVRNEFKYLFNTFIAYYNPDYDAKYYKNTDSHVNFFIDFLNENFGTNLKNVEAKHYYMTDLFAKFSKMKMLDAKY